MEKPYSGCKKCQNKGTTESMRKRRAKLVSLKGGECIRCGYSKCSHALHFHHRDPSQKSFPIAGSVGRRPFEELLTEIAKCDLVCANRHAEIHAGL